MTRFSLLTALLCACSPVRSVTYPPSFRYLPQADIRSTMWHLAGDVVELDRLLREGGDVPARLAAMQAHAAELTGQPTNHPKIDQHLPAFQRDLAAAKLAAEATPPNYALAGMLAGSCMACHENR